MNLKTNSKIQNVAFRLFLEKGYEATNIRDICREVNIKASSLYFYYKSKQELFFSIYHDIWKEKMEYLQTIDELKQNISPDKKLYYLFIRSIDYYSSDITKQKFILRYCLFPPEEILALIREKFLYWTLQEDNIIFELIKNCISENILDNNRLPEDYMKDYKKIENAVVTDMIISNIKLSSEELNLLWHKFWNCTMLSSTDSVKNS